MVRVRLFGELALEVDGQPLPPPASRRARSLLAWLALHPGMHGRSRLAPRFWPDVLDASARASLRSALWSLRRALGPAASQLRTTRDEVGLDGEGLWVDALAFAALVDEGRLEQAVELCGEELLCDLDDDWVLEARDDHRARVAAVLGDLTAAAQQQGDTRAALAWGTRRAALDPFDEEAHRDLIRHLIAAGDRGGAVSTYHALRERFRRELAISPSPETRALVEALQDVDGDQTGTRRARDAVADTRASAPAPAAAHAVRTGALASDLPPLVGRDEELAALLATWEAARAGAGRIAVISGEAGIGKTRLGDELAALAAAEGARVARSTSVDLGTPAPLGLWAELLRDLTEGLSPPPGEAAWRADLALLAPQVEERLGRPRTPATGIPPELQRARLHEAMVDMLEWAAREAPLLVWMDDVHLADTASLELAAHVGRRIAHLPMLILLGRRKAPPSPAVGALLRQLRAHGALHCEVEPARLGPDSGRRLAHLTAPLSDVEEVVRAADGNPLLVVETARALARGTRAVPDSLREMVRAWLADLPAEARLLAEFAAVAGRPLHREELDTLPVTVVSASTSAVQSGLLATTDGRLGYRHALLRDAAYADLAEPRRAWLHETLGRALANGPHDGGRAAEIAAHLRRAGRDDLAVDALGRAARHARSVADLEAAARLLTEALELDAGDPALWLELADVEAWRARSEQAEHAFEHALEHTDPTDGEALVAAWLRRGRWYQSTMCAPSRVLESCSKALETLDVLGLSLPDLRRRAIASAAWAQAVAGDADQADELLGELARLQGQKPIDDLLRCEAGNARGLVLIRRGHLVESYEPLAQAARAAQRAGRPDLAYGCLGEAAVAAAFAGEPQRSLEFVDRALMVTRGRGMAAVEARLLSDRAHVLNRLGRCDEARRAAEHKRELGLLLDRPDVVAEAEQDRGLIDLNAGDCESAQRLLAGALAGDLPIGRPFARLARAEALVQLGRCDEAERELRATTAEPIGPGDSPETLVPNMSRLQGLIAAARGDRGLAERRLDEAIRGWRRAAEEAAPGERYVAVLNDLGRESWWASAEPRRELERALAERAAFARSPTPTR